MRYFYSLFLIALMANGKAQQISNSFGNDSCSRSKQSITKESIPVWPGLTMHAITNNGRYFGYIINNNLTGCRILNLVSIKDRWNFSDILKGSFFFSSNSRYAVWINKNDSLCILRLGSPDIRFISRVDFFNIQGESILYGLIDSLGLYETDTRGGISFHYCNDVRPIIISNQQDAIVWVCGVGDEYLILRLQKHKKKAVDTLWRGKWSPNIIKDEKCYQMAFLSEDQQTVLWYYKMGMKRFASAQLSIDSSFPVVRLSNFSRDGSRLFVSYSKPSMNDGKLGSYITIWSYLDSELQSNQRNSLGERFYRGVLRLQSMELTRIEFDNDFAFFPAIEDTVCLIRNVDSPPPGDEMHWNLAGHFNWRVKSLNSERRVDLDDIGRNYIVQISPYGRYIIYFDTESNKFFTYETGSGSKHDITSGIEENWYERRPDVNNTHRGSILGWEIDDRWVFIRGKHDIWQIDPSGRKAPINFSNGIGRRANLFLSFSLQEYSVRSFYKGESIIISAFNESTKSSGFYRKRSGVIGDPDSLTMGPHVYDFAEDPSGPYGDGVSAVKARNVGSYIVRRMGANDFPNYYYTSDFKSFKPLSNLQPQRDFIWYVAELHSWKSLGGIQLKGVLYKPDNFDSLKKYPVILYYYDNRSDRLNMYLKPRLLDNGGAINIPHYVSNGYLIFCPDIYYELGDPMRGTYEAVVSAAKYLSGLSFVDVNKIGVQGCSWGAIQTNYLVVRTNLFAAACSSSGMSNWVSNYGGIRGTGESMQGMFEVGQYRVGATLWEKPNIYVGSSPIFYADKINTPLLLMHTIDDGICNISDVLHFYSSLFQLKKTVWMLVYSGNHGLYGSNEVDFSMRMKQFFDYYLKDKPPPVWMYNSLFSGKE